MGLGGLLASFTERAHYLSEERREREEVRVVPYLEKEEIYTLMGGYDVGREAVAPFVEALAGNEEMWVKFMMDFELKLERPNVIRAWKSAAALGGSYFAGMSSSVVFSMASTDIRRWFHSDDSVFCDEQRHACAVCVYWGYGGYACCVWVCEELEDNWDDEGGVSWGGSDVGDWGCGCWGELWDCEGV